MSKSKVGSSLIAGLLSFSMYKKAQGQKVRQATGFAVALIFVVAAWSLSVNVLGNASESLRVGLPYAVGILGCWFAYRIVNYPPAADFMISVQGEMDKVSWPAWPQLWRATIVVLVVMMFISVALLAFDILWRNIFSLVGFLRA